MGRSRGTLPIPAGRQHRARRPGGKGLRPHPARTGGRLRRRHGHRPHRSRAVQVGGPLGSYVPGRTSIRRWTTKPCRHWGNVVGHGGIVVHDDTADMAQQARYAMEFCAIESCGKCTPCRIGSTRGVEVIDRIVRAGTDRAAHAGQVLRACATPCSTARMCAMGGHDAVSRALRAEPFPRRLRHRVDDHGRSGCLNGEHACSTISTQADWGTPAVQPVRTPDHAGNRWP